MTYGGKIEGGMIVLDEQVVLPEGTRVTVSVLPAAVDENDGPSLFERLKPVIGKAEGLPSDLARNHDHYLHGRPKK